MKNANMKHPKKKNVKATLPKTLAEATTTVAPTTHTRTHTAMYDTDEHADTMLTYAPDLLVMLEEQADHPCHTDVARALRHAPEQPRQQQQPPPPLHRSPTPPTPADRSTRKGWKCTPKFLLDSITATERKALTKRKIKIPKQGTAPLSKAAVKNVRAQLRKIRNVASAQRHRHETKERIQLLATQAIADEHTIRTLRATVARLAAEPRCCCGRVQRHPACRNPN